MSASDASNAPVRRAPQPEIFTGDIPIQQKADIVDRDDLVDEVIVAPEVLQKDYTDALAFAEEPVTIRIERSAEKFAPMAVDCWVNGKGAEVLLNGRWVEMKFLPVGVAVTTKRKYVEVLARSKVDTIRTDSGKVNEHEEKNVIERYTSSKAPFSVIQDKNPKGAAWLTNLISFN